MNDFCYRDRGLLRFIISFVLLPLVFDCRGSEQELLSTNATGVSVLSSFDWRFKTRAYEKEALSVMIGEVNDVARRLKLNENLPLTTNDITSVHISPPALGMMFATISSRNYIYYASAGKKFSGLGMIELSKNFVEAKAKYRMPIGGLDTNNAFQLGRQIMEEAGMDVDGLGRDCTVEITPSFPDGRNGKYFVPIYMISWRKAGKIAAYVDVLVPTSSVRQLSVRDPAYILRKPLTTTNLLETMIEGGASPALLERMGLKATNLLVDPKSNGIK